MFGSHQLNGLPFYILSAHDALSTHPFFGQKSCGRVFSYIASAHPLPWDCSLNCTLWQWQQASRGHIFLSHSAVYSWNVDRPQQQWTRQLYHGSSPAYYYSIESISPSHFLRSATPCASVSTWVGRYYIAFTKTTYYPPTPLFQLALKRPAHGRIIHRICRIQYAIRVFVWLWMIPIKYIIILHMWSQKTIWLLLMDTNW